MSVWKAIKWVLLAPVILIALGIVYCEANKAYWDHRVRELCEKDGGVTVFERIELTADEFKRFGGNQYGEIDIQFEDHALPGDRYIRQLETKILRAGYPEIRKYEESIVQRNNNKTLVKKVSYSRVGGDFPNGIIHPSSFSCAQAKGFDEKPISAEIHIKEDEK